MSFTEVTVTRDYRTASGDLPTGAVVLTPTYPMTNGATVIAAPVDGQLADGMLSISAAANTDPDTVPQGAGYRVEEFLDGVATVRTYYVVVPHDAGPVVDLADLDSFTDFPGAVTVPVPGPQGEQGATGPTGAPGADGADGQDGRTILSGTGAPAGALGLDGDFFIDTTADAIYGPKTSGAWGAPTPLVGPQGPPGAGSVDTVNGDPGPDVVLDAADVGADPTGTASAAVAAHASDAGAHAALLAGKANASHTHGVGDLTATGTRDATTYLRGDNTWAVPAGGGGGVTDHGALTGLADDDHPQYLQKTGGTLSGAATVERTTATLAALLAGLAADSVKRVQIRADGQISWGAGGSTARDTTLYRSGAGALTTDGTLAAATPTAAAHVTRKDYVDTRAVPAGGTSGQVLTKSGSADFAMAWANAAGGALGGIVDCSAMTTAADVNAAALAAPAGSIIWLGRRPPSAPLVIETTLIRRPYQKWMGAGGRSQLTCVQAGASFPAGQPLMASEGYMGNAPSADEPGSVVGIHLDANGKTGSHGLVVYDFWSHFEDIQVANCAGTGAHGIHQTDKTINGTTVSSNSHSENTFVRCRFMTFTSGASGFWAESFNGASNQDGHLVDCFFASIPGYGIRLGRAAGWTVENCHLYDIGYDAISLDGCYATKVIGNYVEDFGGQNLASPGSPTFGYYNGISLNTVLNTRASIVANNTVSVLQPNPTNGNRFTCFYMRAGSGQTRANLVFSGNSVTFANSTQVLPARAVAYMLGEPGDSGRMLYVQWAGNQTEAVAWWQSTLLLDATTVTRTTS